MPFGSGFGASGAGALGAAYALNADFDLGMTANGAAALPMWLKCPTGPA